MITVNTVHVYKILIFNTYWLQFHNFRGKQLNSSKFEGFMGFYTGGCRKFKSQSFNILANEKFNQNSTLLLQWFSIKLSSHSPTAASHMRKMAKGESVNYYNIFWEILFLLDHLFPNITAFWICILVSHLGNVEIYFRPPPPPPF